MSGALPQGACDTHAQVFGPGDTFAYAVATPPADAPKEQLSAALSALGFDRAVIVQPTPHGSDNSAMLDALKAAPDAYRGVAVVPEDVSADEIARLHDGGVRAIRANFVPILGSSASRDTLLRWEELIAPRGWSIVAHLPAGDLPTLREDLDALSLPIAVDHLGRISASAGGVEQPAFRHLLDFAQRPNVWVKLSGSDRVSTAGAPYDDLVPFIERLAAVAPDRLLWGSNWPHPNLKGPAPDETVLLDALLRGLGSEDVLRQVLVVNPDRLYFS
jgi:2-pyrone-4,6-dicarboxylate lactonase